MKCAQPSPKTSVTPELSRDDTVDHLPFKLVSVRASLNRCMGSMPCGIGHAAHSGLNMEK